MTTTTSIRELVIADEPTRGVIEDLLWDALHRALPAADLGQWILAQGDQLSDTPGDLHQLAALADALGTCGEQLECVRAAELGSRVTVTIPDLDSSITAAIDDLEYELGRTSRSERLEAARRLLFTLMVEASR